MEPNPMNRPHPTIDRFERACKGDSTAFAHLADELYGTVYGVAFSTVGNWSAAQDIAQETFLIAWTRRASLRNTLAFPTWIRCIAANVSKNWLRSQAYRRKLTARYGAESTPEAPAHAGPDSQLDSTIRRAEVWRALEGLSPTLREAVVLYYLHGESLRDVATALGITENAAKKRIQQGRAKLRAHFEDRWKSEMTEARGTVTAHSARDRFLAGIALGPAAPELAKSAAKAGIGLWWEMTKQSGVLHKAALGGSIMTAKKITLAGLGCLLLIGGTYWAVNKIAKPISQTSSPTHPNSETASKPSPHKNIGVRPEPPKEKEALATTPNAKPKLVITPTEIPDPKDYAIVNGTVIDENNAPVPGAKVTVAALGLPKPPEDRTAEVISAAVTAYNTYIADRGHYWSGTTDANGAFEIKGIRYAGMALITASAEDHVAAMRPVYLEAKSAPVTLTLELHPGMTLRGRLLSADGKPVTDGSLRLVALISPDSSQSGVIGLAVLTDSEGRFELAADMKGLMSISANSAAYGATTFKDVEADPDHEIDLQYPNGTTIHGHVTDEAGKPVPHVEVRLAGSIETSVNRDDGSVSVGSTSMGSTLSAETADDGAFQFANVDASQTYQSAVMGANGVPLLEGNYINGIEPGTTIELNLIVHPAMSIQGVIYGQPSQRPIANVNVFARLEKSADGSNPDVTTFRATSGPDGKYTLTITGVGGTFEITPATQSTNPFNAVNGTLAALPGTKKMNVKPGDAITLDLYMHDTVTRTFHVIDSDGKPIQGAQIMVEQDGIGIGLPTTTDAKGRITLSDLPPQINVKVTFNKEGYLRTESEEFSSQPGQKVPEETIVMQADTGSKSQ